MASQDKLGLRYVCLHLTTCNKLNDVFCLLRRCFQWTNRTKAPSIQDFSIVKVISRGAFGRVFLAKKRSTGDYFAIKVRLSKLAWIA